MENEVIFSEPLENAHTFSETIKRLDEVIAVYSRDKLIANELLKAGEFSESEREHLSNLIHLCEQEEEMIRKDKEKLRAGIELMLERYEIFKKALDEFKPDIYH